VTDSESLDVSVVVAMVQWVERTVNEQTDLSPVWERVAMRMPSHITRAALIFGQVDEDRFGL
jgi:hypothetical protein